MRDLDQSPPPLRRGEIQPSLPILISRSLVRGYGLDRLAAEIRLRRTLFDLIGLRRTAKLMLERFQGDPLPMFDGISKRFQGKRILEIGGPSKPFGSLLPIYKICGGIDNVEWTSGLNAADKAIAEVAPQSEILRPRNFFVAEAADLGMIAGETYDAVISSHVLEHLANPVKAIKEWRRILKIGGTLLAIVPRREFGFDHGRSITLFEHILGDYVEGTSEDDPTHVNEMLLLHDVRMDSGAWPPEVFRFRVSHNLDYRVIHHHVFDDNTLAKTVAYAGFSVELLTMHPLVGTIVVATATADIEKLHG